MINSNNDLNRTESLSTDTTSNNLLNTIRTNKNTQNEKDMIYSHIKELQISFEKGNSEDGIKLGNIFKDGLYCNMYSLDIKSKKTIKKHMIII